jgi:hypothetical protein
MERTTGKRPLLGSGLGAKMELLLEALFSTWSAPMLYHSTDRVQLVSAVQLSGVE